PMARHNRIDGGTVLAESPRCTRLIGAHQPAVTGDIGGQDGGKLVGRAHGPSGAAWSMRQLNTRSACGRLRGAVRNEGECRRLGCCFSDATSWKCKAGREGSRVQAWATA